MNILNHPKCIIDLKHIQIVSNFYIYNINFLCHGYRLTSLYGCPRIVRGGDFNCSSNKLKTLKYCPIEIHGDFNCSYNLLESLEHCPKYVGGDFYCLENKKEFTRDYIRSICDVRGMIII